MNHEILLRKSYTYGVRGTAYEWFRSYLTDRKQRVKICPNFSVFNNVLNRVPQGRVLGRLLFILYINELPKYHPMATLFFLSNILAKLYQIIAMKHLLTKLIESYQIFVKCLLKTAIIKQRKKLDINLSIELLKLSLR